MLQHFLLALYFLLPPVQSESGYIECIPGTLNVILAAPHGGYEEPDSIPDREAGCYDDGMEECTWTHGCGVQNEENCDVNNIRDAYTKQLAELLADNLKNLTSKRPHLVINHLHRKKLDANRDIGEAALGNAIAEEAFNEFHQCINEAKETIKADDCVDGTGLFLDIHGHGHPNNWAELGYLIYGSKLDSGDFDVDDTSIKYLLSRTSLSMNAVLRGNQSFGHFLEAQGYSSVPSPTHNGPAGEKYFSGGYNTKIHGSRDGGSIDAIQIESARINRNLPERTSYAAALAQTVVNFLDTHYTQCDEDPVTTADEEANDATMSTEKGDHGDTSSTVVSTEEIEDHGDTPSTIVSTDESSGVVVKATAVLLLGVAVIVQCI